MKFKKLLKAAGLLLLGLFMFMFLNNSNLFVESQEEEPLLLAHRGMGQTFPMEGIIGDTCTAERIHEPEHPYLENTIPSMEAAFEAGADIVELDIHPTTDGKFAVFHDWTLNCRTDGTGVTREYTMEELKQLDIGYGYTADNGKTYPFRGKGVGFMPSLDEVLNHFPEKEFLLHIKSDDTKEGKVLAGYLKEQPEDRLQRISVYGGDQPVQTLREHLPDLRVMSKQILKSCLLNYAAAGWTGTVPSECQDTQIHLPEKFAPWMWGWPGKFVERMNRVDTRVILVAGDGSWSEGFDHREDLERLPEEYNGVVWTNRIDIIAPLLKDE
nr:glycerophosphodiester phosphodiesterase family protein [Halobacillus sp. Marseille-Q1614]